MIKLRNEEIELTITIEGYAYPFSRDYWDSNWLSIDVYIKNNSGEFYQNNDPCLSTTELIDLKKWFQNNVQTTESKTIEFIEPCISFTVENRMLTILMRYNLNPIYNENPDSVYKVSFQLNEKEIERIIFSLDKNIEKFPEKIYPK